jgi:HEAT repeat protein
LSHRLSEADTSERENWLEVLAHVDSAESRDLVAGLAAVETESLVRLEAAQLLVEHGDPRGVAISLELLEPTVPPLVRDEAYQLITRQAGEDFGFDPFGSEEANAEAIERIQSWAERP